MGWSEFSGGVERRVLFDLKEEKKGTPNYVVKTNLYMFNSSNSKFGSYFCENLKS
jgi:hypothetical protein